MFVNRIVRLSYFLPALALLSGCGGGSSVALPSSATVPGFSDSPILPQASHYGNDSFIITAQLYGNDAEVYQRKGSGLIWKETISYDISSPEGTVATPNGYWYLTNGGHSNVLVYKVKKGHLPPQNPIDTLDDYGQLPVDVSATPDRNLVPVSNQSTTSHGAGSVSIYLNRQSEPSRILTYGTDTLQGEGIALDHQGNCFWSFNDPNTNSGSIVEFPACYGPGTPVVTMTTAGGVAFDQSGNLYYVDQAQGVYQCSKTSACTLWAPNQRYGFSQPNFINFDYKSKDLWLSDAGGYMWAISTKSCGHGKTKYLCVHKYSSGYGDPYGIAPLPGA